MPFIEINILMSLFRIARCLVSIFFEDKRRQASFCGSTKAIVEEEGNDGGYSIGLI
jgi:hypothetical protein